MHRLLSRGTAIALAIGSAGLAGAETPPVDALAAAEIAASSAGDERPRRQRLGIEPRPERTASERAAYLAEVREWYERPPSEWPGPTVDDGVEHRELGPLSPVDHPESNPYTPTKKRLGKMLFFDPRISGSGQLACASCHDSDLGWADGRTVSFGHNRRMLGRNAPSIRNSGHRRLMFWDGRAGSIEQQARDVLANADEMHSGDALFIERLEAIPEYRERFEEVFGDSAPTVERVADALACFQRTIVSSNTPFDRFARGRHDAISDEAISGLHLFRTDARCVNCHNGPLLSDDRFHNIGLTFYGRRFEDLGRYAVTGEPGDVGKFRTPSLRDVLHTGPYMHNGLFDLNEALVLYNAGMPNERPKRGGGPDPLFPAKSPLIKPLGLNGADLDDLRAFLATLSEPHVRVAPPRLPPGL
ncbi:MAG: cytochrome c peroxidase [Planctomycetota bacterium]